MASSFQRTVVLDMILQSIDSPDKAAEHAYSHLKAIIEYEETQEGKHTVAQQTQSPNSPTSLTALQARGFRRDIMAYWKEPKEVSRLLRIIRRLKSKEIPKAVLFDSGIEFATHLLIAQKQKSVQRAAIELGGVWAARYTDVDRTPCFMQAARADKERRADHNFQLGLVEDLARTTRTTMSIPSKKNLADVKSENADCATHAQSSGHLTTSNLSANASNLGENDVEELDTSVDGIFQNLGALCTETLQGDCPELDDHNALPNTDLITPLCGAVKQVFEQSPPVLNCAEDFISTAKTFLQVDDRKIELLSKELATGYNTVVRRLDLAASCIAAVRTINACSIVTEKRIRDKEAAIATLVDGDDAEGLELLYEERSALQQVRQKQDEELEKAMRMRGVLFSNIMVITTLPLRKLVDAVCGGQEKETRSLYGPSPDSKVRTVQDQEVRITSSTEHLTAALQRVQAEKTTLESALSSARQELQDQRRREEHARTQSRLTQEVLTKLKRDVENERTCINSKYYKDVEIQVGQRLQHERAEWRARLKNVEAKTQRHDAAIAEAMELKHQLKACLLDNQVLKSAKTKLETERQAILEREKAMHQGYEQMGREKEDAELRALTLDEKVHKLKTKVEQLPATSSSTTLPKSREAISTTATAAFTFGEERAKLSSHRVQLSEADRLDLLAQKWVMDLQHAESKQNRCSTALQAIEDQIAAATRQIEDLQGDTTAPRYHEGLDNSKEASDGVTNIVKVVPVSSRRSGSALRDFPPLGPVAKPERTVRKSNMSIGTLRLT